jgi:Flp pilus assembly pilin Flp
MLRSTLAMLIRMLVDDDAGNALVEYAVVAAAIAVPLLCIGYAIAQSSGTNLSTMTTNMSNLGITPP